MTIEITLTGARVLRPGGWDDGPLGLGAGQVWDDATGRQVDLRGYDVLPGIVDAHGDGFERHMAPRRGALRERDAGMWAVANELASNGITTAMLAQFWSWEGGLRGPEFALEVLDSIAVTNPRVPVDLRPQLRIETHYLDAFEQAEHAIKQFGVGYVVMNDHLPHDRLAAGRTPKRLTGQALKSGRNPADHLALMQRLHEASDQVPAIMDSLCARLSAQGVLIGSHDDDTPQSVETWSARGARVSEFPETPQAAEAARALGMGTVMGAPNVVRGASHAGKVAAKDIIASGLCDALASDYHYPSPARAAWRCIELGLLNEAEAWALVSSGPARLLGLADRGTLETGKRADLIVMDRETRQIVATIAGGEMAFLSGNVAARFVA